ncbi:unnamed protein product [Urochloa decumbens]|uniref:F-box domain-containing protein n=1 Tax=Urochloa decumbens TaxID=240449 RepID=A0ABC9CD60_9POAL
MVSTPATGSSGSTATAEDRLSSLPDKLLHNIMSFLPAWQAVQTCVLSPTWRNLWRSMPCLDIDQREFDAAASRLEPGAIARPGNAAQVASCWGCAGRGVFAQKLRSGAGCPVLEDLRIERCLLDSPEITCHTLKRLVVIDCGSYFDSVLTITAPALASFHLAMATTGCNWRGIIVVNEMPSLVKASVCSSHVASCKLLCSLVNVQMLELSGSKTLSMLHMESDTFPTFHNLRILLFDGCNLNDNFKILGCFLNNAPTLEKLTVHYCQLPGHSGKRKRTALPIEIPAQHLDRVTFQCTKLKWTEIKNKLSGIWSNLQKSSITVTKA